jgi:hypothetical protein
MIITSAPAPYLRIVPIAFLSSASSLVDDSSDVADASNSASGAEASIWSRRGP